jgi:hypothetical protein
MPLALFQEREKKACQRQRLIDSCLCKLARFFDWHSAFGDRQTSHVDWLAPSCVRPCGAQKFDGSVLGST